MDAYELMANHENHDKKIDIETVGELLNISPKTVETHKANIYRKLKLHNNAQFAVAVYVNAIEVASLLAQVGEKR